tara:strand:+ start:1330 stop:1866 length:537 start_codon:yes stop_codon:yes gene_type:complete
MNIHIPKIYCFIDDLNKDYIDNLKKDVAIIYRNYKQKLNIKDLIDFNNKCKKKKRFFYLANYPKIAIRLGLNGAYIPSFNKKINLVINKPKKFLFLGSAHNLPQMKIKEKQNVDCIFVGPLFLTHKSKNYLGLTNFKRLSNKTEKKVIALGGLNKKNLHRIRILKIHGYASISLFKKK